MKIWGRLKDMLATKDILFERKKKSPLELACNDRSCIVLDKRKSLEVAWMGREVLQTRLARRDASSFNDQLQPKKK